jgi:hypothetical protein
MEFLAFNVVLALMVSGPDPRAPAGPTPEELSILNELIGFKIVPEFIVREFFPQPFVVNAGRRYAGEFPYNFSLPLGQHIVNAKINFWHQGTIDNDKLGKPQYGLRHRV